MVQKELFTALYQPPHRRVLKSGGKSASESDLSVLSSGFGSMTLSSSSLTASLVSVNSGKGKGKAAADSSRDLEGDWRNSPGSWAGSPTRSPSPDGLGGVWSKCGSVSSESSALEIKVRRRRGKNNSAGDKKSDESGEGESKESIIDGTISPDNAQAVLPNSACVFVANLPYAMSDDDLSRRIQNVFSQFAQNQKCWTIVRRDDHNNPFAFVQYLSDEEASRAVLHGRGIDIGGRAIRTEESRANRLYFFAKNTGENMPLDEAVEALKPLGGIETIWKATESDMANHRLGRGFFVKATFYTKARDAVHTFNRDETYRLVPMNCTPKSARRLEYGLPVHTPPPARKRPHVPQDCRSVFVGGLPVDTTERQLSDAFAAYDQLSTQVCQRESRFPGGKPNCFGFVEFTTSKIKLSAALEMDGKCFPGTGLPMKVKFKSTNQPPVLALRSAGENVPGADPADVNLEPAGEDEDNGGSPMVKSQDGSNASAQRSSALGNDTFMMSGTNGFRSHGHLNGYGLYPSPGNFDGGLFTGHNYGHPAPGNSGFMGQPFGGMNVTGFGHYMGSSPIFPTPPYLSPQPGMVPFMPGMQTMYNGLQPASGQFFGPQFGPSRYAGPSANAAHPAYGTSAQFGQNSYGAAPGYGPVHNGSSQFGAPPPYGAASGYGTDPVHHGTPSQYGAPPTYSPPPEYAGQFNTPASQWAGYNGSGRHFQPQYSPNYGVPATGAYAYPPQGPVITEVHEQQAVAHSAESTDEAVANVEPNNAHEQTAEIFPQVDAAADDNVEQ